jgi:hypothetical protein
MHDMTLYLVAIVITLGTRKWHGRSYRMLRARDFLLSILIESGPLH